MSDQSLRKAGRAELDRLNKKSSASESKKAKPRKRVETSWGDLMGQNREKTVRSVEDAVNEAVDGAKLSY